MVAFSRLLLIGLLFAVVACGTRHSTAPDSETPLTLEQWKALSPQTKYDIDTLERLKQGNPKLQEQPEWDKFTRSVLLPGKKKDMPASRPNP